MAEDLAWARDRASSKARASHTGRDHEDALTEFEFKSLSAYRERFPMMAYSLTQNGASSYAQSSSEDALQTLIHNMGFLWSDNIPEDAEGGPRSVVSIVSRS